MNLRKILLSPLLHFFVLGALIFGAFAVIDDTPKAPPADQIVLSIPEARRLAGLFDATWNRPPTPEELDGLMQSWALEEANVREALALGLDRDDSVIRQRLNLKMQFLAESGAAAMQPDDAMLQAYLAQDPDRFMRPAQLAFDQVLLPQDGSADPDAALRALRAGADPTVMGAQSLLPPTVPLTPAPAIDRTFGEGFHAAVADLTPDRWQGPVKGGYGWHLVRVTGRVEGMLPPLSEIRDRVEAEWRAAQVKALRDDFNQALLGRYAVTLPVPADVLDR